jgi:hypothetical protein
LTVTVAVFVSPLPVPVTVTVKVPAVEEVHDSVEPAVVVPLLTVTLVGERLQLKPDEGEIMLARLTVPANPLIPVTVMPDVPVPPEAKFRVVGFATNVKS